MIPFQTERIFLLCINGATYNVSYQIARRAMSARLPKVPIVVKFIDKIIVLTVKL